MSAPIIWIVFPFAAALLIGLPRNNRFASIAGGITALLLAGLAWAIPTDTALRIGSYSLRIDSAVDILGRSLSLTPADQTLLVIIYGLVAFWFFGTLAVGEARRIVPIGLIVTGLLIASLAVEPFLYAALLIEIAVLLSIPMLIAPDQPAGRGILRFLIYQTLAMPFILFAGFLLAGVEASPGDVQLVVQSAILLGLGFAFLLAVFPFNTWIPLLTEEAPPYAVGFILFLFPTIGILFALGFLDRYSWLRESPQLPEVLRLAGLLMLGTSGLWVIFQRHLGRIFGYAAIAETGLSLLALTLSNQAVAVESVFLLIVPRALALGIWAMSIAIFKERVPSLRFGELQGLAREYPFATAGLALAAFSIAGMPLLASFPIRQVIWSQLAAQSLSAAFWMGVATLGLWIGALRTLAVLAMSPEDTPWESRETPEQRLMLGLGMIGLIALGLFPQWIQPVLIHLPNVFEHLGR
jgi:formate hydrogenlyase subunit 3/multisubunit Na+/H+ antiporter MnhD subunit